MIDKILVPLDGSSLAEEILPYVRSCAEGFQAVVHLLKVNDPDIRPPFTPPQPGRSYLKQIRNTRLPKTLQVECHVKVGKPAETIVGWSENDPGCLVAMATHGFAGARRWFLGSVTSKVVQGATNPLLIVRPADARRPALKPELKTLIVALDGSELAERVLPYATAFAKKLKLSLILLRVCETPIDALQAPRKNLANRLAQRKALLAKEAQEYLEARVNELRNGAIPQIATKIVEGYPASALIDLAEKDQGNMVAMTTHGRSGLSRWIMGSVAEKVIHHSRAPVLLVRCSENAALLGARGRSTVRRPLALR